MQSEKAGVFRAMRPLRRRRRGARPVRGLPAGEGRGAPTPMSRPSAPCACSSTPGAGRACPGTCARASVCATTAAEVLVQLKPPPQKLFADSRRAAGRRQLPALPAVSRTRRSRWRRASSAPGKDFVGDQRELYLREDAAGAGAALRAAAGRCDGAATASLFTSAGCGRGRVGGRRSGAQRPRAGLPYAPGTWGPAAADALIAQRWWLAQPGRRAVEVPALAWQPPR